jgi:diguanylate cyclase (GGDEF)-like protein
MIDIDNFRNFNNTFGHAVGDDILRRLGSLLSNQIREEDVSSRIGGDEFIILLPDASKSVTQKRAQLFLEQVRKINIKFKDKQFQNLTISLGIAAFPEDGKDGLSILKAADAALYKAKHEGRDRISTYNAD